MRYKDFNNYLKNNGVLNFHLENVKKTHPNSSAVIYMQDLLDNYDILSKPLSIQEFGKMASEYEWKNLAQKSAELTFCDVTVQLNVCQKEIQNLVSFVENSNLAAENKDKVISFFNDYVNELNVRAKYTSSYIESFNQEMNKLNRADGNETIVAPKISIKLKQESAIVTPLKSVKNNLLPYTTYSILLCLLGLVLWYGMKKLMFKNADRTFKKFIKVLYFSQKNSLCKMRFFGMWPTRAQNEFSNIVIKLADVLQILKTREDEISIRFLQFNDFYKLEITSQKNQSLGLEFEDQMGQLKTDFQHFLNLVEGNGGEVLLTTEYNSLGNVDHSKMELFLPR